MAWNAVLLRGLSREARHWGAFPSILGEQLPGMRVLALDIPGVGVEKGRDCPASVPEIARDFHRRFEAQRGEGGEWFLLGVSFGGMIAMSWVEQFPDAFRKLVLVNTSAANLGLPHQRMRPEAIAGVLRATFTADPTPRERLILSLVSNVPEAREAALASWTSYATEAPITRATLVRQLAAASRYPAPRALPIPSLVVVSDADRFVHPGCSERLSARIGAPLLRHPTAGHDLSLDDPRWLADQVSAWLGDAAGAARAAG